MTDERKQQLLNLALDSEPFDVHNHVKIVAVDDGLRHRQRHHRLCQRRPGLRQAHRHRAGAEGGR